MLRCPKAAVPNERIHLRHLNTLCAVLALPVLCISLTLGATAAHAAPARPHLVIQCPINGQDWAHSCEAFRIAAHPTLDEHSEATAQSPYIITTCVIYASGNANDCVRSWVARGDQVIA